MAEMALNLPQIARQARTFFRGLSLKQRVMLGLSVVVVIGTLWLFVTLIERGQYQTLYSGLSPAEAQTIVQRLASLNIPSDIAPNGTLRVPASSIDRARLALAAEGLPQTGRQGFELFDKTNWAGSDFAEQVNYQRALEGELERTIESLSDVAAARVHLVMPHESLFTERQREAKAAVLVRLRGARLSEQSMNAITYLVSSAVDNLPPENVTVVDANGYVPLVRGGAPAPSQRAAELETALADKVVATLAPIVGADQVRARITVEYNLGSSEDTSEVYDPKDSVVLTSQITSDQSEDTEPQGVPGTPSNVPQAAPAGAQPATAASADTDSGTAVEGQRSESKTFAVGKTVRHTVTPPGNIKRISAAVLVDDAAETKTENGKSTVVRRARTPEEMKKIEALASAAIGIDPARGDVLAVENVSFSSAPLEAAKPAGLAQRIAPLVNQWTPLIRWLALALLFGMMYWLVLRPLKNQLVAGWRSLPEGLATASLPSAPTPALAGEAGLAAAGAAAAETMASLPPPSPASTAAPTLRDLVAAQVEKAPADASRVIETWLRE
jgi:flagellar M-ring protein FliF